MADAGSDDILIGQTVSGRFRVVSKLGAGGMGVAYRAWDEQNGLPVVIKIPKRVLLEDSAFAERFYREVRLLQGLSHPHIVPILDVGGHDGLPYVAMRFLPGGSLSNRRLRDENGEPRPNPPGMLHLWLTAVASALDFVHASGVVHRDVKPANIFFDAFWGAYLGDFGIAKIVSESGMFAREHTLTGSQMLVGTQDYMAPEQFTPKAVVDDRVDQYALAVLTYEMVSGFRPFTGKTAHLIVEVTTQPPPPLRSRLARLPPSLVDAVHRGLAKNPDERFRTCGEFAAATLADLPLLRDEAGVARLLCPRCANVLKLPMSAAGQKGKCPRCQSQMKVAGDLGALWLLDEARRQGAATADGDRRSDSRVSDATPVSFAPLSGKTWISKTFRRTVMKRGALIAGGVMATGLILALLYRGVSASAVFGSKQPPPVAAVQGDRRVKLAEQAILEDPLNPTANEILARHWCFEQGDWARGLPYLAKSSLIGVSSTARDEITVADSPTPDPGAFVRIAQRWWKLAKQRASTNDASAPELERHAVTLFSAHIDAVTDNDDHDFITAWLDSDSEFRERVGKNDRSKPAPQVNDAKGPPKRADKHIIGDKPWPTLSGTAESLPQIVDGATAPTLRNSIGMDLRFVAAGEFKMGSEDGFGFERPAHRVRLTKPFYLGICEVTNAQWAAVMGGVPSNQKDSNGPVEMVSWDDAVAFCEKLSALPEELAEARTYRLPTSAEWEFACRAGTTTRWSFGDDPAALVEHEWVQENAGRRPHAVGGKKPNPWGFHDMHGNVWEWCNDWCGDYSEDMATDPRGPPTGTKRVIRGGNYFHGSELSRSSFREFFDPSFKQECLGFRVVLSASSARQDSTGIGIATQTTTSETKPMVGASEAADAASPRTLKNPAARTPEEILAHAPLRNSVGIALKLIPPGSFRMGSDEDESGNSRPAHAVRITKPFYLGVTEVTESQWKAVMGGEPSDREAEAWETEPSSPVVGVSWEDAKKFCDRLSALPAEKASRRTYRLPTEAEWEYACRAGTTTRFSFGDAEDKLGDYAWFSGNFSGNDPVGTRKPNPWGLHDMHGSVWEWCNDWEGPYAAKTVVDPTGPPNGSDRVLRGGCSHDEPSQCESIFRAGSQPSYRDWVTGFRLAMSLPNLNQAEVGRHDGPQARAIAAEASEKGVVSAPLDVPDGVDALPSNKPGDSVALPLLTNSIGIQLKFVPTGGFLMGAEDGRPDEKPPHRVEITKSIYLGVTEVTNKQWQAVMGSIPSPSPQDDLPVENMSWEDALTFCKKLSDLPAEKVADHAYRLPTEAEWEYACRAGSTTRYSFGDDEDGLAEHGWLDGKTYPVAQKKGNSWGFFDMHGNVWEWCQDRYGGYSDLPAVADPIGPMDGSTRVYRGGGRTKIASDCRSARRGRYGPSDHRPGVGLRVVLDAPGTNRDLSARAAKSERIPHPRLPTGAGRIDADAPLTLQVTKSGLGYRILRKGSPKRPTVNDAVKIHLHMWLTTGQIVDSSYQRGEPVIIPLNRALSGMAEGVQLVGEGGMIELRVPPSLGFGERGAPDSIPPNATLSFLIEVLEVR